MNPVHDWVMIGKRSLIIEEEIKALFLERVFF